MFNIFNKKKKKAGGLTQKENQFISVIVEALNSSYPMFKQEFETGTFAWIASNRVGGENSFVFGINNDAWQKLCDTTKGNFLIKNIHFKNNNNEKVIVELYTTEGLIVGFGVGEQIENIELATIDVSKIWEKHFLNNDYTEIEKIVGSLPNEKLKKLNMLKNTFKMEICGNSYYPIHDIEDGNYLVIDMNGSVFKITHDPLEVQKISNTLFELCL
ncbi:MAG: hypothetical protein SFU21_00285 [Flavihumibacter sp.]|nr:hypothetical protein [Flavihumibacter sp.]